MYYVQSRFTASGAATVTATATATANRSVRDRYRALAIEASGSLPRDPVPFPIRLKRERNAFIARCSYRPCERKSWSRLVESPSLRLSTVGSIPRFACGHLRAQTLTEPEDLTVSERSFSFGARLPFHRYPRVYPLYRVLPQYLRQRSSVGIESNGTVRR